ncbi:MAG: methionyl-tRNA formyltransferase [Candidatus Amesbacteria bacterium]|nr:methionyl-tRNA formyltransferase [Candidatus Amesbacteria bacterium]
MQRIVFFGSSIEFSPAVLQKLAPFCVAVVTTEDKPVGRHLVMTPNPVKVLAQKLKIPVFDNIHDFLKADFPDCIGIIAAYGKIIGPKTMSKLNNQIYGIHPSLLPKYRGPSPLQQQILDGISETGVTIFKINLGEDTGPILMQEKDLILPTDTKITLGERLFAKGVELVLNNELRSMNYEEQDHSQATHTKKFTRQDGFVNYLEIENCKLKISRMQRAFYPWPGVWTIDPSGKRIKIS